MWFIEYEETMFNLLDRIEKIKTGDYQQCDIAKQNVFSSVEDELDRLQGLKIRAWRTQAMSTSASSNFPAPRSGSFREIDTCKRLFEKWLDSPDGIVHIIAQYFIWMHGSMNPIIVAIYVIAAVMLVISGVSESTCSFLLEGLSLVAELCLSQGGPLTQQSRHLLHSIAIDSRRVIKVLRLTPNARSYVCCPKCFACYPQTSDNSYPTTCTHKKTPSSAECGRQLRKSRVIRGAEHTIPVRRFVYHDFKEWLGELLCRPGMEDLLDRDVSPRKDGTMHDIWDGPELHALLGVDGNAFIHHDGSEGRYIFSFCMDGFNPFQLKQAGKKASVVVMYMICMNLPPEDRYKMENMFLVGIIPGPHEPRKEEINHLLSPLVNDLLDSYKYGIWYSRTHNHKSGRYARSALVPVVCDTPASRQVTGRTAATSATHFCPFCHLPQSEIKNYDRRTWDLNSDEDHRAHATAWSQAETEEKRNELYKAHGVRYSELLRLPYWSPTRHTAIDSMHTFFLILFKRHCDNIWGMDAKISDGDGTVADPVLSALLTSVDVQRAFIALRREPVENLGGFKAETLKVLTTSLGMEVKGMTKSVFVKMLSDYVRKQTS